LGAFYCSINAFKHDLIDHTVSLFTKRQHYAYRSDSTLLKCCSANQPDHFQKFTSTTPLHSAAPAAHHHGSLAKMAWFKKCYFRVTQARQYLPQEFGISGSVRWNGGRPVDLHRVSFAVAAADQSPASSASAGAPHPSRSGGDFCPPVQRLCCAGTCGDSGRIAASSGTHLRAGDAA